MPGRIENLKLGWRQIYILNMFIMYLILRLLYIFNLLSIV